MSWWIDTLDFYQEAARQAAQRVNKAEKPRFTPELTRGRPKKARLEPEPLPTETRICALTDCHQPFSLNLRGPQRIYCSQYCNAKAWKQRKGRHVA